MNIDAFTLFLIFGISVLSGLIYFLYQQEPVESNENPLGEYLNSPVYSQGVLDFYRKTIQDWVVVQFQGWKNVHKMDYSNRDHFRKLTAQILLDFFDEYSLSENVKFEYCLFSEKYLINYVSMMAMETMSKLVEMEIQNMEEWK